MCLASASRRWSKWCKHHVIVSARVPQRASVMRERVATVADPCRRSHLATVSGEDKASPHFRGAAAGVPESWRIFIAGYRNYVPTYSSIGGLKFGLSPSSPLVRLTSVA